MITKEADIKKKVLYNLSDAFFYLDVVEKKNHLEEDGNIHEIKNALLRIEKYIGEL